VPMAVPAIPNGLSKRKSVIISTIPSEALFSWGEGGFTGEAAYTFPLKIAIEKRISTINVTPLIIVHLLFFL